jgi:hypothetical protein
MLKIVRSDHSVRRSLKDDPIILIYQFFKHRKPERNYEIIECLWKNANNEYIDRIILLNERIYSEEELGVSNNKVEQINIGRRLQFSDIFKYVEKLNLEGYIVTCNADIFLDKSLQNIKYTGIHDEKTVYSQLRFEYTDKTLSKCKIFGPRCDSQDTWIFHSNCNIPKKFRSQFKIKYGIRNCDLKLNYLFNLLDFKIINDPYFIKTYHYHKSNIRDYFKIPAIKRPLMFVIPFMNPRNDMCIYPMNMWCGKAKTSFSNYFNNELNFFDDKDMDNITGMIKYAQENSYIFSIPKTNIHSTNLAYLFDKYVKAYNDEDDHKTKEIIGMMQGSFKNLSDRGLKLDNIKKLSLFSNKMLEVFTNSQISIHTPAGHSKFIDLISNDNDHQITSGPIIHKYILDLVRKNKKIPVSENILNIGAHMFRQGWMDIIENKRILIISKHYPFIQNQIKKLEGRDNNFYKRDIFRKCTYQYMDIPQLQEGDDDFISVVNRYIKEFGEKVDKNSFDMVFIGDTPYDFFILNYLQTLGKSGIIGGEFLPLWYGLYSKEHLKTNCDIVKMYMDENWMMIN